jgi:hypothetical protein
MKRPLSHLSRHVINKENNKKNKWVKKLVNLGLKPEIGILELAVDWFDVLEKEKTVIAALRERGCRLLNMTDGGDGCYGRKYTAETIEKMRQSHLGKSFKWSRTHSEEEKRRKSESTKEWFRTHPVSEETRKKLRISKTGKRMSPETIVKMKVAKQGTKVGEEAARKSVLTRSRSVVDSDGNVYLTLTECCKKNHIHCWTLNRVIQEQTSLKGRMYRLIPRLEAESLRLNNPEIVATPS